MKIKLTLKQLLTLRDSIINELKSNQRAMIKINSCKTIDKEFNRDIFLKIKYAQEKLRKDLIQLKVDILIANYTITDNKILQPKLIFTLSELKEELKCYQNLNMKKGKFKEFGKYISYSTIISEETANKRIDIITKEMNSIEDSLTHYNNKTFLNIDVTKITFDIASKIIN